MTHEKPLPAGMDQGFIYKQKTHYRFYVAVFLSSIQVMIIAHFSSDNVLTYFLIWLLGIPALLLGFLLGPQVRRLWGEKEKIFQSMDKAGESDAPLMPKAKNIFQQWWKDLLSACARWKSRSATAPPAAKPPDPPEPEIDGRESINNFTRPKG
jgi:hypothetical protein